jgi:hypothetical protein
MVMNREPGCGRGSVFCCLRHSFRMTEEQVTASPVQDLNHIHLGYIAGWLDVRPVVGSKRGIE